MPRTARISRDLPQRSAVKAQERTERRDAGHLQRVRDLPCCVGYAADYDLSRAGSAHHLVTGRNMMGKKAPDRDTIPLRHDRHMAAHASGDPDGWVLDRCGVHPVDMAGALYRASGKGVDAMSRVMTAMIDRARAR